MRKLISLLLALVLVLSFTACGGGEVSSDPVDSTVSTGEADTSDTTTTQEADSGESTTDTQTDSSTSTNKTPGGISTTKPSTTTSKTTTASQTSTTVRKDEYVTVNGSEKNLKTWVYQLNDSGMYVREARFNSGKGGDPATIIMATDVHFTEINDKDRQENNAALMWTHNKRQNEFPTAIENVARIMTYAADYDQTIFTGDNIDYLSWGNLDLVQKNIWGKDPNALVALGNHEPVRTLNQVGEVKDTTTLDSRYAILKSVWKHDVYYTSKVIKNKVMIIQLDNSQNKFWKEQLPKLQADLDTARKNGYVVLLFYHIPLRTGNKTYRVLKSFYPNTQSKNFYTGGVYNEDDPTRDVYNLITNSADVIKGVFCGHEHFNYYMEINAKTPDGKDATIPQYVLASSGGDNLAMASIMKITVN